MGESDARDEVRGKGCFEIRRIPGRGDSDSMGAVQMTANSLENHTDGHDVHKNLNLHQQYQVLVYTSIGK